MKIVVDAHGGDNAPQSIVEAAVKSVQNIKDLTVVLAGDETKLKQLLQQWDKEQTERIQILHAPDTIDCDEVPTSAIRNKKESSMVKALEYAKTDADGIVSAGSTGALLTGAFLLIGRMKGILRPALCPVIENLKGGHTTLIDCGANADCKKEQLLQFAVMGSAYLSALYQTENPKIALLSNGTENEKGNALVKETNELFRNSKLNFIGNIEGRDLLAGDAQVIVCDGFTGNVALKSYEGAAGMIFNLLKDGIKNGGLKEKIGYLCLKPILKGIKKKLDYNEVGGACFLGVQKVVVKAHGSSGCDAFVNAIRLCDTLAKARLCEKIAKELESV